MLLVIECSTAPSCRVRRWRPAGSTRSRFYELRGSKNMESNRQRRYVLPRACAHTRCFSKLGIISTPSGAICVRGNPGKIFARKRKWLRWMRHTWILAGTERVAWSERVRRGPFVAPRDCRQGPGYRVPAGLARDAAGRKGRERLRWPRGLLWVACRKAKRHFPCPARRAANSRNRQGHHGSGAAIARDQDGRATCGGNAGKTRAEFPGRWGTALHRKARGGDTYEFFGDAEPKSISHNHTFSVDTEDRAALDATLSLLCQKAMKRLRDASLSASTVTLTIRYAGFETITFARIRSARLRIWTPSFSKTSEHYLTFTGTAAQDTPAGRGAFIVLARQSNSWTCSIQSVAKKMGKLAQATDCLRDRFGFSKVQFGGSLVKGKELS